jgi:hypothetical protein
VTLRSASGGHDVIADPRLDGLEERMRAIEVLAELHRRLELTRERRIAREIVVSDRLFDIGNLAASLPPEASRSEIARSRATMQLSRRGL